MRNDLRPRGDIVSTRHAMQRRQQRSIPQVGVDALIACGSRTPAGGGTWRLAFDKVAWRRAEAYFGSWPLKSMERLKDLFAIVTDADVIITVGYRNK